jgi:predicted nucleic acid-binding Zn finger protein
LPEVGDIVAFDQDESYEKEKKDAFGSIFVVVAREISYLLELGYEHNYEIVFTIEPYKVEYRQSTIGHYRK